MMTGATALSTSAAGAAVARAASPAAATTMTGATALSTLAAGAAAARAASPAAATTTTGATEEDLARATAAVDTARVERAGDVCFPRPRLSLYRRSLYRRSQKNQDNLAGGDL